MNYKIPNYYKILEVSECATAKEIKDSYKSLAKKYHPDKNNNINSNNMVDVNIAYEILSDEKRRYEYDQIFPYKGSSRCLKQNINSFNYQEVSAARFFAELSKLELNDPFPSVNQQQYNRIKKAIKYGTIHELRHLLANTETSIIKGNINVQSLISIAIASKRDMAFIDSLLLAGAEFSIADFKDNYANSATLLIDQIELLISKLNKKQYIIESLPYEVIKESIVKFFNINADDHPHLIEMIVQKHKNILDTKINNKSILARMILEKQYKVIEILLINGAKLNQDDFMKDNKLDGKFTYLVNSYIIKHRERNYCDIKRSIPKEILEKDDKENLHLKKLKEYLGSTSDSDLCSKAKTYNHDYMSFSALSLSLLAIGTLNIHQLYKIFNSYTIYDDNSKNTKYYYPIMNIGIEVCLVGLQSLDWSAPDDKD